MRASLHTTALTALTLIASSTLAIAAEVRVLTVDKELAEKTFDAIILSVPAMDFHDKAGSLAPRSRVALARVGVGVVVKEGAPVPTSRRPRS